ncbi:MAG: phospholipid carrier-dependent glycosyltransferase [Nocardiopsaceae bacterium]|nr:phospholipid carrier-dependent glycosyltransferase [Nocardiopsaceae bacterium]
MTATQADGTPGMDPDKPGNADNSGNPGFNPADPGTGVPGRVSVEQAGRIATLRARLATPMPDDGPWGWIGPLLVTAFAAFMRFSRLAVPHALIFDETYYAKDAWSILTHGVEWCDKKNANALILSGHTDIFSACSYGGHGELVVQPPLGKLFMAVGEWLFGLNSLGWRVAPALFGTLAILLMCRVARRMTRSTLLGCLAGLLLSLDGLEFVMSRVGLLDIFLMFFVLAAFGCLLVDRDRSRSRLAAAMVLTRSDDAGPELGIRKWRVAAGVMLGLACASKQYGSWYVVAFIALAVAWDIGARRAAGVRAYIPGAFLRDGKWLPLSLGVIPVVTYVVTWTGWLLTSTGYYRNYAQTTDHMNIPVISALWSLIKYHQYMAQFAVQLHTPHPYESQPWDWLVISRPVALYWNCYTGPAAHQVCPSGYRGAEWAQEVLAIGNPAIWWVSIPALLFCLGWWFTRRDWRAGAVVLSVAAGWLTWFPFVSRTKFYYYALEFEPFLILSIVLCLGLIIGPGGQEARTRVRLTGEPRLAGEDLLEPVGTASRARRAIGVAVAGAYTLAVLALFWYFYPILAGKIIPYQDWYAHMWYHGWI